MLGFFHRILIVIGITIALGVIIRLGLRLIHYVDRRYMPVGKKDFEGFTWYFRLPGRVGDLVEYYFYFLLGNRDFFSRRAWPIKIAGFLSLLLCIAFLFKYRFARDYLMLENLDQGISYYVHSGFWGWYINTIVIGFIILVALIIAESIRMGGKRAWLRPGIYIVLSVLTTACTYLFMASLVVVGILYIIVRFIISLVARRRVIHGESGWLERNFKIMTFSTFREALKMWETELSDYGVSLNDKMEVPSTGSKKADLDSSIPRIYPDR